jgi:hypothetical protein
MLSDGKTIDTLRLPHGELRSILDRLDRTTGGAPSPEARRCDRFRYNVRDGLVLQVEGATADFLVHPRRISPEGINFLHGSFLYPGTSGALTLRTTDGEQVLAAGKVIHCRCVHGRIHEVSLLFSRPIEIENFVAASETERVVAAVGGDGSAAIAYPAQEVLAFARKIEELATTGSPLEQLQEAVTQLTTLLANAAPPPAK